MTEYCRNNIHTMTGTNIGIRAREGTMYCRACKQASNRAAHHRAKLARGARTPDHVPTTMPPYTGTEPCNGQYEVFFPDTGEGPAQYDNMNRVAKAACQECPLLTECGEWALHREKHGTWGGWTATERDAIRRTRGIRLYPLEAEWSLDDMILEARARVAAPVAEAM